MMQPFIDGFKEVYEPSWQFIGFMCGLILPFAMVAIPIVVVAGGILYFAEKKRKHD